MLGHAVQSWASLYANHAVLRTAIVFVHLGGLVAGGGCAITADLATISVSRGGSPGRAIQLQILKRTHSIVVIGLVALVSSGLFLLAADLDTYIHSVVFWLKMG